MPIWANYYLAQNLDDALRALSTAPGPARCIAGGTDLLLDLQQGRHPPLHTLVDVSAMPETSTLEIRSQELFIGAAVPLSQIVRSPLAVEHSQALVEACALIGGPQVRNTATLGGNVCHALPAADGTIALLAHEAQAEIARANGLRKVSLSELFAGPGKSTLDPHNEILVGFYLPLKKPCQGSAHRRVMRPQGVAIAILNMAVWIEREADRIQSIHISLGPSGPTPFRARRTEEFWCGRTFSLELFAPGLKIVLEEAHFRTSPHRATQEYRRHLAGILLEETLTAAWQRTLD
jgi:xanthine dehydrogenase FAD-binding subunit